LRQAVAQERLERCDELRGGMDASQYKDYVLVLLFAKKPERCLEYIVVHAMVHLLERRHNDRFCGYMDQFVPRWRICRKELNRSPLSQRRKTINRSSSL
jgi:predicted metal-dependent hydrolase